MLSCSPETSSQKTEIQCDELFQKITTSRQTSGRSMTSTPRDETDTHNELSLKLVQNKQEDELNDTLTQDVQPISPKIPSDLSDVSVSNIESSFQLVKSDSISIDQSANLSQKVLDLTNIAESRPSTAPEMSKHEPLPVIVNPTPTVKATTPRGDSIGKFPPISLSAKVSFTPNTGSGPSNEGKHRAVSMFVGSSNQASVSEDVDINSSNNSSVSTKMSPSEKFRTFMKSFTPARTTSIDMTAAGGTAGIGEGYSSTTAALCTPEEEALLLQSRIAKVQEEQLKFRKSQKHRFSLGVASQQSSFRDDLNRNNKEKTKKTLKMNISGKGPNFNGLSISAGLHRAEFRATLEQGNALLKHSKPSSATEDHFDVNSLPLSGASSHMGNHTQSTVTVETQKVTPATTGTGQCSSGNRTTALTVARQHRPVTVSGEGYMSESDWRITNKKMQEKRLRKLLGHKETVLDMQPTSYLNLDQVIEASLKEQAALTAPVDDCPDTPDVPLSYLQSAHLIERRFGWDKKDHSLSSKSDSPQQQHHTSWFTLRSALHATGNFNIIAAAAAAGPAALTPQEEREAAASASASVSASPSEKQEKASPEPGANAPIIVVEATPVTDFVAKLVQEHQHRSVVPPSSNDEESTVSPDQHKYPAYKVSTQVPRRKSPEKPAILPLAPKLQHPLVVAKEDAKTMKEKANTKEFHDRYHGLIFHDSSRNLIWQDTEDLILGTMKPTEDNILHHRSDMRWAGKTLNMFRPWSAARQEDVIDQFLHQKRSHMSPPSSPPSRPVSCPGTPGTLSTKNSPGRGTILSRIDSGDCSLGGNSTRISRSGGGKRNADAAGSNGSVGGGSTVTFSVNSKQSRSAPQARKATTNPPTQRKSHNNVHHDPHIHHHAAHSMEQSDNVSVLTNNSSVVHYNGGSVSGTSRSTAVSRRTPLLVNIVKPVSAAVATSSVPTQPSVLQ